jgi:RimJ/RimL family protein N-acetyltransferase
MEYGWKGELVRLVPIDPDKHFENAVAWINDPEVTHNILFGDFPMTKLAEREWFDEKSKNKDSEVTFAIETLGGKHIGFSGIFDIHWRYGTANTGTLIGDQDSWGKGFGTDAARTRNRYAFEVLGIRMLYSDVFEGNTRSLGMLKRAGYMECGRRPRRIWKRGAYVDEILLYLDRESWQAGSAE